MAHELALTIIQNAWSDKVGFINRYRHIMTAGMAAIYAGEANELRESYIALGGEPHMPMLTMNGFAAPDFKPGASMADPVAPLMDEATAENIKNAY
jgi:hypothetical protein